jgi:plastocyanin
MTRLFALAAALAVTAAIALPAFASTKTVSLRDNFFSPKSTTVAKNTTVRWVWKGSNPHNVFVKSGPRKFHSTLKSSGTYRHKMTVKGTYRIICQVHPGMTLKLVVK